MKEIKFTVLGQPVAKGRPKFGNGHAYTPEKTVNYEQLVKVSYLQTERVKFMDGEQLRIEIKAYSSIPKSVSKMAREGMMLEVIRPTKKPDFDNICKGIADALNDLAYKDDSQIVSGVIDKYYSGEPRVEVLIYEV